MDLYLVFDIVNRKEIILVGIFDELNLKSAKYDNDHVFLKVKLNEELNEGVIINKVLLEGNHFS